MGNSMPRTLVLSALAATMLTQPAAALPQGASPCQKTTARRLLVLGTQAGDCLKACHDDDAAGTSRRCGVAAPDGQLARCLERAKRKAVKGILRTCVGAACPECYAGANCRTFAKAQAETAVQGSGLYFDSFYCDDAGSSDGLTNGEAQCREAAWTELRRFSTEWLRCQAGPDPEACVEQAGEDTAQALRTSCREVPECAPLDRESMSTLVSLTSGVLEPWANTIFCDGRCGNGTVDAGEECDPKATPTGCGAGFCDACHCRAVCGDGVWNGAEVCDESAGAGHDGCADGLRCTACLFCAPRCGDGQIASNQYGTEVCELPAVGCPAGEECIGCSACGRTGVPVESATEDITPCADSVGDRWTFEVEAGTVVTVEVDTVDATTAASLGIEGACGPRGFRASQGRACAFAPPDRDPGFSCPTTTFVAPATGTCTLTVGVHRLDPGLRQCQDTSAARYRLSVSGTALTLVADDVPPGLTD